MVGGGRSQASPPRHVGSSGVRKEASYYSSWPPPALGATAGYTVKEGSDKGAEERTTQAQRKRPRTCGPRPKAPAEASSPPLASSASSRLASSASSRLRNRLRNLLQRSFHLEGRPWGCCSGCCCVSPDKPGSSMLAETSPGLDCFLCHRFLRLNLSILRLCPMQPPGPTEG